MDGIFTADNDCMNGESCEQCRNTGKEEVKLARDADIYAT